MFILSRNGQIRVSIVSKWYHVIKQAATALLVELEMIGSKHIDRISIRPYKTNEIIPNNFGMMSVVRCQVETKPCEVIKKTGQ